MATLRAAVAEPAFGEGVDQLGHETLGDPALIQWLLEGPSYVRYRTLTDLLGRPADDRQVRAARAGVSEETAVKLLLGRRNASGLWGAPDEIFKWWPRKDTTFWVLGVLADFGLTRDDCRIDRACEYVLSTQLSGGGFGVRPPPRPYDCFTGILASALARMGYLGDQRLERAYTWLSDRQRLDGGFWCKDTGQPGGPREHEPSCAYATLCVVSALAADPALLASRQCRRGAAFLLECWDNRGRIRYAGHDSQIGTGWEKIKYPFTDYRIIYYLDTLTRLPLVRRDARITEMVDVLRSKADREGRFLAESIHKAWSAFDFGQKKQPSRWLTCLAHGILTRVDRPALRRPAREPGRG